MITVLAKALAIWLVIALLAIANGMLREKTLIPVIGTTAGLAASGLILSACVFVVSVLTITWYGLHEATGFWSIGALWLVFTVAFELALGRWLLHKPWRAILEPYTFTNGNIWPLVLVVTAMSPWLAARLRGII